MDEGHITGMRSTRARFASEKISAHARWAITGTPFADADVRQDLDRLNQFLTFLKVRRSRLRHGLGPAHGLGRVVSTRLRRPHRVQIDVSALGLRRLRLPTDVVAANELEPSDLEALWQLLQRIVVRHQPADIHRAVALPPCHVRGMRSL